MNVIPGFVLFGYFIVYDDNAEYMIINNIFSSTLATAPSRRLRVFNRAEIRYEAQQSRWNNCTDILFSATKYQEKEQGTCELKLEVLNWC